LDNHLTWQLTVEGEPDSRGHPVRRRVHVPPVDERDISSGRLRPGVELQQHCALADAPSAVHEQHPPRRAPGQGVIEADQLTPASYEAVPACLIEKVAEVGGHPRNLQRYGTAQRVTSTVHR
jgi:hypothetical protein